MVSYVHIGVPVVLSEQFYVMHGSKTCLKDETNLFIVRPAPKHMGHCCLTSAANLEGDRIDPPHGHPPPCSLVLRCISTRD